MLSVPPASARSRPRPPFSSIAAASNTATMLVEHASTVENAGVAGSSPASSTASRAILLMPRLGITVPHTKKSGRVPGVSCFAIARTTGTDSAMASNALKSPSTRANGVRSPATSHTGSRLMFIVIYGGWLDRAGTIVARGTVVFVDARAYPFEHTRQPRRQQVFGFVAGDPAVFVMLGAAEFFRYRQRNVA